MKLTTIDWVALVLVIIGGINLGLVGIANFDLINTIFGTSLITRIVDVLIGLSAIYVAMNIAKLKK